MSTHITKLKPQNAVSLRGALFCTGALLISGGAIQAQGVDAPVAPLDAPASPATKADGASALPGVTGTVGNTAGTTGSDAALGGINFADAGLADARNRASDSSAPLSLVDAIYLTLRNNPQRDAAQAALAAARSRIGAARSAGGLQVGLSGGINADRSFGGTGTGGNFNGGTGIGTGGTGTGGIGTGGTGTGGTGTGGTGTGGTGTDGSGVGGNTGGNGGNSGGGANSGSEFLGFGVDQSLGIAASLPILNGGRVKASTRAADFAARAQAAQTLQTEQDLVLNTITSYLSILRSDQLLQVAESNLSVSRERLRVANVRFEAGAAARLDVFRAQTTLADAIQRRITASNALAQSKAALNTLIGRVPEAPLRVQSVSLLSPRLPLPTGIASGISTPTANALNANGANALGATTNAASPIGSSSVVLADGTPVETSNAGASGAGGNASGVDSGLAANPTTNASSVSTPVATSAQLRAAAEQARPALAIGRNQIGAADATIDVARAQRKPQLGLSLSGFLRNPVSFAGRFALGLGLNVAQGLFDSGRSRSQINEAQALAEQARQSLQGQRLNVANQIEQALLALDSARGRSQSSEIAVASAQEAVRAAQLGYEAGVRTSLEVSDAQTALLTTQTDAVNARFDVASSQAQVSAAVGVLTQEGQNALERTMNQETARAQAIQASEKPRKKRRKFLGIF